MKYLLSVIKKSLHLNCQEETGHETNVHDTICHMALLNNCGIVQFEQRWQRQKTSWGWVGPSSAQLGLSLANLIEARASGVNGFIVNITKHDLVCMCEAKSYHKVKLEFQYQHSLSGYGSK